MINGPRLIPMLLEACPSFRKACPQAPDDELLYEFLGKFAHHLLDLFQSGKTEEFSAVAGMIERLHVEGDADVREAATIGLLEGIQNVWRNNNVDPELFFGFLHPESAKWWRSLNKFWDGTIEHVGEDL